MDRTVINLSRMTRFGRYVTPMTLILAVSVAGAAGCSSANGPTFEDLGQIMTNPGVEGSVAWEYESMSQLLPQERSSGLQPAPADFVAEGSFVSLHVGNGYVMTPGRTEPTTVAFDDPNAWWRDAIMTFDVDHVWHASDEEASPSGEVTIRVIVPLEWTIDDVSAAYRDKPNALVFLVEDPLTEHYRILGGVGEFYLPFDKEGRLNHSFVTEDTRASLSNLAETIEEVSSAGEETMVRGD